MHKEFLFETSAKEEINLKVRHKLKVEKQVTEKLAV